MLDNDTIWTITDTLESARDNAADLLGYAESDGREDDAKVLREALAGYERALAEFSHQFSV